jgi:ABC-type sugar transport system ATPase subunit
MEPSSAFSDAKNSVVLRAVGISKSFGATKALTDVDLDLHSGTVLALLGENGAGKSTLISIASGAQQPTDGWLEVRGERTILQNPLAASHLGIQVVHQEPMLANERSIAENIYLSELASGNLLGLRSRKPLFDKAREHLEAIGLIADLPGVTQKAGALTAAERQLVTIARAMASDPKIVFLDEPNSSLTSRETEKLWAIVRTMKSRGVAVVVVSHRLKEIYDVAERVAVLRDGEKVGEGTVDEIPIDEAVRLMAGGEQNVLSATPQRKHPLGDEVLRLEGLSSDHVKDVNLVLRTGEVVGMAGLVGSGRSEIARAIAGVDPVRRGRTILNGRPVRIRSPRHALKAGIVLTSEERRKGLFPQHTVGTNSTASVFARDALLGFIRRTKDKVTARAMTSRLTVRGTVNSPITSLSGGNQQKVLIGRALAAEPKILILDEPTHGVDVGTKREIYKLVNELADRGLAILFISSEIEEIFEVADRIVVARHGSLVADMPAQGDAVRVVAAALGETSAASDEGSEEYTRSTGDS